MAIAFPNPNQLIPKYVSICPKFYFVSSNLNLRESNFTPPSLPLLCWFSLNNSETVKVVTLLFCSILEPVTKLEKRNKTMSKKFDDGVMLKKCNVIIIFSIYGEFGAIRLPDCGRRICKGYVYINNNFLSYKNWKQNKKSLAALTLLLWVKVLFLPKNT